MLTNYDLEELCDVYNVPLRGIYMKDMLPKKIQNGNYIINLESSNGGQNNGTHWTCLVVRNKDTMFYDPYGAPPSIEIRNFVQQRKNAHLGFNNWVVQDLKSENCGYFVLSFLVHAGALRNKSPAKLYVRANNYINQFVDDTIRNDEMLRASFRKLGKAHPLIHRLYNQSATK